MQTVSCWRVLRLSLACLLLPACGHKDDSQAETGEEKGRWTGLAEVLVVDPGGNPVEGALVMMGGAAEEHWVATDSAGQALATVTDDGVSMRFLHAGLQGWVSGGVKVPDEQPAGVLEISLASTPSADNLSYEFQPAGSDHSLDSSECGHCHPSIAGSWLRSAHSRSASNALTWDLYTGSASLVTDAVDCVALGGHMAQGQAPGEEGVTVERCYVGEGVLPWLNENCGESGEDGCDHPDNQAGLNAWGACGDCHSPAIFAGTPGSIDYARAFGVSHEGVTCDFCHKVEGVTPGGAPGLNGAIDLRRPSDESTVIGQVFEPVTFGPYPDVTVPIMNGSYTPQFRDSEFCSACHEYAQPALHPGEVVDDERWPGGLPVFETWSEHTAWTGSESLTCQSCHMSVISEESSTYDITPLGLAPSPSQGWVRDLGQVRSHEFGLADMASPTLLLQTEPPAEGQVVATVTVRNQSAGHAIPTGEPMRQYVVVVAAKAGSGEVVAPIGGQVVPDVGGALAIAVMGETAEVELDRVRFLEWSGTSGSDPTALRIARPTGAWIDDDGPGTASTQGLSLAEKGLPELSYLGEYEVVELDGEHVVLGSALPLLENGDLLFLVGEGDLAGRPGWLYAKTLTDAGGSRGVAHFRAVSIASDNRIAPGGQSSSTHIFPDVEGLIVTATLTKRRIAQPIARTYGWPLEDRVVAEAEAGP